MMTPAFPLSVAVSALVLWTGCQPSSASETDNLSDEPTLDSVYVAGQTPLFMEFWSGMTPSEYADVAEHHVRDSTFWFVKLDDAQFELGGAITRVLPTFQSEEGGPGKLTSVMLTRPVWGEQGLRELYDLYRTKYGEPEEPLRLGPEPEEREEWYGYCRRAFEGTPSDHDAIMDALVGRAHYGCGPNPESRSVSTPPVTWRDGDRVITLVAEGVWRSPDSEYSGFSSAEIVYTTQSALDAEAARREAERTASEAAAEQERLEDRAAALESI